MKTEILQSLVLARKSHLEWLIDGDKLLRGDGATEARPPLNCTQCEFGKWYYTRGIKITNLPSLKQIERLHDEFHRAYMALYYKRFDRRKSKDTNKFLNLIKNHTIREESTLEDKFEVLKHKFQALYDETKALEDIVSVMSRKLFDEKRFSLKSK